MLVQLTIKQVTEHWPLIKATLPESYKHERILESLMLRRLVAWFAIREGNAIAVLLTELREGELTGILALNIFYLYSFSELPHRVWQEGLVTLSRYAAGKGASRVTFSTQHEGLKDYGLRLGGECEYFVSFNLTEV